MQITHNGNPLTIEDLCQIDIHFVDIDDTAYHKKTRLHDQIKKMIVADANANPDLAPLRQDWSQKGIIAANGIVEPGNLGVAFPLIVNFYRQQGVEKLANYLLKVYNVDYGVIPPQPAFVKAVMLLREGGKKVVVYTNGPFGVFNGQMMHVNKVFHAIGFPADAFTEKDVVDLIKTDRMPELLNAFQTDLSHAADVFRKPTRQGFLNACKTLNVLPQGGEFRHVSYLDDSAKNFSEISVLGVNGIIVGLSDKPFAEEPHSQHARLKVWQEQCDNQGRYFSTAGLVLESAARLKPFPSQKCRTMLPGYELKAC